MCVYIYRLYIFFFQDEWDPNVGYNAMTKILAFIRERVSSAPGTTFRFDRETKSHIYCTKLTGRDHMDLLPKWYTKGLFADDSDDDSS